MKIRIAAVMMMAAGAAYGQFPGRTTLSVRTDQAITPKIITANENYDHDLYVRFLEGADDALDLTGATQVTFDYAADDRSWSVSTNGALYNATNGQVNVLLGPTATATNGVYDWQLRVIKSGRTMAHAYGKLRLREDLLATSPPALATTTNVNWADYQYQNTAASGPVRPDGTSITNTTNADGSITLHTGTIPIGDLPSTVVTNGTGDSYIGVTLSGRTLAIALTNGNLIGWANISTNGGIDETNLDTSVNASLDLADSATQPADDWTSTVAGVAASTLTNQAAQGAEAYGWGDHGAAGYATEADRQAGTNTLFGLLDPRITSNAGYTNEAHAAFIRDDLDRDGSRPMTGNLDMGGNSITNVSTNSVVFADGTRLGSDGTGTYLQLNGTNMLSRADVGTNAPTEIPDWQSVTQETYRVQALVEANDGDIAALQAYDSAIDSNVYKRTQMPSWLEYAAPALMITNTDMVSGTYTHYGQYRYAEDAENGWPMWIRQGDTNASVFLDYDFGDSEYHWYAQHYSEATAVYRSTNSWADAADVVAPWTDGVVWENTEAGAPVWGVGPYTNIMALMHTIIEDLRTSRDDHESRISINETDIQLNENNIAANAMQIGELGAYGLWEAVEGWTWDFEDTNGIDEASSSGYEITNSYAHPSSSAGYAVHATKDDEISWESNDRAAHNADEFTISFWVWPTDMTTSDYMFSTYYGSYNCYFQLSGVSGGNGKIFVRFYIDLGIEQITDSGYSLIANQWNHVCTVYESTAVSGDGYLRLYVNGTQRGTANVGSGSLYVTGEWALNGRNSYGPVNADIIPGTYEQFAVWTNRLSVGEVGDLYNSGSGIYLTDGQTFASSGRNVWDDLVHVTHFDEGSGSSTIDNVDGTAGTFFYVGSGNSWSNGYVSVPGILDLKSDPVYSIDNISTVRAYGYLSDGTSFNSDPIFKLSEDGGSTYSNITMTIQNSADPDQWVGEVNLSGNTNGVEWFIDSTNNQEYQLHGVQLYVK